MNSKKPPFEFGLSKQTNKSSDASKVSPSAIPDWLQQLRADAATTLRRNDDAAIAGDDLLPSGTPPPRQTRQMQTPFSPKRLQYGEDSEDEDEKNGVEKEEATAPVITITSANSSGSKAVEKITGEKKNLTDQKVDELMSMFRRVLVQNTQLMAENKAKDMALKELVKSAPPSTSGSNDILSVQKAAPKTTGSLAPPSTALATVPADGDRLDFIRHLRNANDIMTVVILEPSRPPTVLKSP